MANLLARIAFVCEGDAENDAFSGTAKYMIESLRKLGHDVKPINTRAHKSWRVVNAMRCFSLNRERWRSRFRYGEAAFTSRSSMAKKGMENLRTNVDIVFQIGATFAPPVISRVPYVLYCDWNMALSMRFRTHSGLSFAEMDRINDIQKSIYGGAATIFTICERLRQSFIDDYEIPSRKVVCAYPSVNMDLDDITPKSRGVRSPSQRPTVLFIGKDFHRKGGDVLLEAFRLVRKEISDARLVIIGVNRFQPDQPNVEILGILRKSVPAERERLIRALTEADVFCLPSRHDPFPNVIREAMFLGLPCVTTDVWAFPEMVVDGETGFTVPVNDPVSLASRLSQLLSDPKHAQIMGEAGRLRAERLFSWDQFALRVGEQFRGILDAECKG